MEVLDEPQGRARRRWPRSSSRRRRSTARSSRSSSPTSRPRRTSTARRGRRPGPAGPGPRGRTRSRPDRRAVPSTDPRERADDRPARPIPGPSPAVGFARLGRCRDDRRPRRRHRGPPRPDREPAWSSYRAFLRIPCISALPEHAPDCRARRRVAGRRDSTAAGLEHVEVAETGGNPIVYARLAPRRRTRRR